MREDEDTVESKDIEASSSENIIKIQNAKSYKENNILKKGLISTFFAKDGFFRDWIIPVIAAIGIALLINKFLVYNVYIPSESMVPTLNIGDKLMVTRVYDTNKIKRGDIIVFYSEELNEILIKRAIGLPGDKIVIHNGIVNINGEDIKEDYVKNNEKLNRKFEVPNNKFSYVKLPKSLNG